jgi:uncharacterized membrane protein
VLAAIATATLVGPVAYHRVVFRQHQKEHLVKTANVMALAGLAIVALAVTGAVLLVVSFVVPGTPAAVISVCVFLAFVVLWLAVPLVRREREQEAEQNLHAEPGDTQLLKQLGKVAVVTLVLRLVPPVRARRRALRIAHGDLLPYRRARTIGQLAVDLGRGAG